MPVLQRTDSSILGVCSAEAGASTLKSPPPFLDLAWREGPDGTWIADATPLARTCGQLCRKGWGWEGLGLRDGVVEWDLARASSEPVLSRRLASWERTARAEAARIEARDAMYRPIDDVALAAVQADLRAALSAHPWAFGSKEEIARGFAEAAALSPGQHRFARALLQDARCVVAAVDKRLADPAGQEAVAHAEGRETDLLEACRVLSELDADRARDANSRGWDAISSPAGHRLAGREFLSPVEAGHALQLVYRHRRQLPAELRDRLGLA
ncbi:hypothetical protein [Methylobacterium mesophilicum]